MIESPYGVFNARALSWTSSLLLVLLLALVLTAEANARPVSYVGGWTIIETSNRQSTAALVHYTATPKLSVGGRGVGQKRRLYDGRRAADLVGETVVWTGFSS